MLYGIIGEYYEDLVKEIKPLMDHWDTIGIPMLPGEREVKEKAEIWWLN